MLPVFDFDENERVFPAAANDHPLYNYWGYSTTQIFALKQNYAADVENAVLEFKAMVYKFHPAGLEIWLDVVLTIPLNLARMVRWIISSHLLGIIAIC